MTQSIGMLAADYPGCKPSLQVTEGQSICSGDVLFTDRIDQELKVLTPVSGIVTEIRRGQRRSLTAIVIERPDSNEDLTTSQSLARPATAAEAKAGLLASGLWAQFRQRPFGIVPATVTQPAKIFVTVPNNSTVDPNDSDPLVVERESFLAGLEILALLSGSELVVCCNKPLTLPAEVSSKVREVICDATDVAMLAGPEIHRSCQPTADNPVFEASWLTVIQIGRHWLGKSLIFERNIHIHGACIAQPGMYKTSVGQSTAELLRQANASLDSHHRLIAGSPLNGRVIGAGNGFVGLHDLELQVLAEPVIRPRQWLHQITDQSTWLGRKLAVLTQSGFETSLNGAASAMLPSEAYERVWPFDVPALPLLRALLTEDDETAEALGALAMLEPDLAPLTWVCPAKYDYGQALRGFLARMASE